MHDIGFGSHYARNFLLVDNMKAWVSFPGAPSPSQGWDFGIPNSSPVMLPGIPTFNLNATKHWDAIAGAIKDTITGDVTFSLPRFVRPSMVQWDGWYLVADSEFGEVLILDFNGVFPQ